MRKSGARSDKSGDPFEFDALMSVFQGPDAFMRANYRQTAAAAVGACTEDAGAPGGDSLGAFARLKGSIENHPLPCMIVSAEGQIISLNEPAHTAFDLEVSEEIDLCGLTSVGGASLADRIREIIETPNAGHQRAFCRARYRDRDHPVTLAILPNRTADADIRTALVFFIDFGLNSAISSYISSAYDLTESERSILEMFILGDDLEQIAEGRGRSLRTVRTQFYSALGKCGLTSQVDLVREIVAGSLFQSLLPQGARAADHPHRRELRLMRPKGRTLEVVISGDFQGKPVMLLAAIGVQKFAPRKDRKMSEASVCIYSISPPGYGQTSPAPEDEDPLECLCSDVSYVLDQLGLKAAPFVSFGPTIVPTLRLARRMPNRVRALMSFLTILPAPYQRRRQHENGASALSFLQNAVLASPHARSLMIRAAVRAWSIFGTRKMAKLQCRSEPAAAPFLLAPETLKSIDEGFRSAIEQGFDVVVRDTEELCSDWREDVANCPIPIKFIHGVDDQTTRISAVRTFAEDFAEQIRLVEIEGAGSFMHVTHEDLYISLLKDFAHA